MEVTKEQVAPLNDALKDGELTLPPRCQIVSLLILAAFCSGGLGK